MSNEVISVDAESEQNSVGNISAEDFVIQRLGQTQGEPVEDTQEVQEEEVLEEAVESEEEVIQQYSQQPDVQKRLQEDEAFAARLQKYAGQYQFAIQQAQNAQIGRIGTQPAQMGGVQTQNMQQ